MATSVDSAARRPLDDGWGARLAALVVDEVAAVAGGSLRPDSAALLRDLTVRGYGAFLASLDDDATSTSPERMALIVGDLFDSVEVSLEDVLALQRHLEQVLLRELIASPPTALEAIDPDVLRSAAHRFFNDLAAALADRYLAARRGHDADRAAAEQELLDALLAMPLRMGDARRVARQLDVELEAPWEVLVVTGPDAGAPLPAGVVGRVRRALFGAVVLAAQTPLGLVVAVSRPAGSTGWPDLGPDVRCGIGCQQSDARGLRGSHEQALEAVELAARKGLDVLHFDDAWFDRFLLGAVSADELAATVLEPVADLTPHRRAAVLETLEAYLDSGSSVGAVADALHLHRQSVNYRMQHVRRLFGPRLMSPNGRLALHIAVKAARLQRT